MWSIEAMLALVFFVLLSNIYVVQYVDSATTPQGTTPVATQDPVTGIAGQQPAPGSLLESSSRLANAWGELVQRFIQYKKNYISSGLANIANSLNSTNQFSFKPDQTLPGAPGANPAVPNPPAPANPNAPVPAVPNPPVPAVPNPPTPTTPPQTPAVPPAPAQTT